MTHNFTNLINRLKTKLVWRWIGLIPVDEVKTYAQDRLFRESMNGAYKSLVDKMIKQYYTEMEDGTKVPINLV